MAAEGCHSLWESLLSKMESLSRLIHWPWPSPHTYQQTMSVLHSYEEQISACEEGGHGSE